MAGGTITEKVINSNFQNAVDKNLVINPSYAYIAPFSFGTGWNEIQLGAFISFVKTGDGNENVGFPDVQPFNLSEQLGGNSNDEFFYFGIAKTGTDQSGNLPSGSDQSGFIGFRGDAIQFDDSTASNINRINNIKEIGAGIDGRALFFSSSGTTMLETGLFNANRGNYLCVGLDSGNASEGVDTLGSDSQPFACAEHTDRFCAFWGARFKIINKGQSNQLIRFTAQSRHFGGGGTPGTKDPADSQNDIADIKNDGATTDVSTGALSQLLDGNNVVHFSNGNAADFVGNAVNGHGPTTGFIFNNGGSHVPVPDAFYIYNGFNTVRPRIHTWGVKVIS